MNIAKIRFAYFTPIMLTRKIVYNVAYGVGHGLANEQYNLTSVTERTRQHHYAPDELLVAALPTFGGRVPQVSPPLLRNLHGEGSPAVVITTYGNRGYDDTLLEMKTILEEQGFVVVAGAAFITRHALSAKVGAGRPDADDLQLARSFGAQVREKLDGMDQPEGLAALPGNQPFKPLPSTQGLAPITTEECVLCMQCYRWCPTDAIPYNDPNHTHADKCVLCHGCIVRCPVEARKVVDEPFQQRVQQLEENFAAPHPAPDIFL